MADERYIEEDPELDQGSEATEEDGEGAGLYEHFAVVADKGQTPLRLDKFLTVRMEKCSRNRIQAAADCGNILVNGKPAKSSYKVKPLDRIQIVMPYPRREVEIIPEDIPLEIPYEDDDLLIVNKPAGLVVHPGHGNYSGTLVNALTYHLRNLPLFQEGDMRAGLVHRIDKNTSGLLVVAKNEQAHARLAKQFFDHTIQRRYVALVWGNFDQDEGTITGNIGRSPRDRQKMFVFEDGSDGKHAVTHWRVLKRYGYVTLVEAVGDRYVVVTPPNTTLTTEELDHSFDLPYERAPHPRYNGKGDIPAWEMIKHSVNIHRGCFGGCSFCTISAHQGKFINSRSERSILDEVRRIASMPGFRGYLSDVGAPSANMYRMGGRDKELCRRCRRPSCLHPKMCPNLDNDHRPLLALYEKIRAVKGIKKAFVGSGIRYDLFDDSPYLATVVKHHTSGRLKVAPEHTEDAVLKLMRKPPFALFEQLNADFQHICRREGLPYQLIPYFISSHPGCTERDMCSLSAKVLGKLHFNLEQVQDLTPTPMTLSSVMFYTGENPYTHEKVYVARSQEEKRRQKAYFFGERPAEKKEVPDRKGSKGVPAKASRPQSARPGDKAGAGKKATRELSAKTTSSKGERPGGSRTTRPIPGMHRKR